MRCMKCCVLLTVSAQRIHENNVKRVVRALEVYDQTGMTINEWNAKNKRPEPKYDAILFALCPSDRQMLYDRIDRRVDQMAEQGLVAETERLWKGGKLIGTAGQAIGYKELVPYLEGRRAWKSVWTRSSAHRATMPNGS